MNIVYVGHSACVGLHVFGHRVCVGGGGGGGPGALFACACTNGILFYFQQNVRSDCP